MECSEKFAACMDKVEVGLSVTCDDVAEEFVLEVSDRRDYRTMVP